MAADSSEVLGGEPRRTSAKLVDWSFMDKRVSARDTMVGGLLESETDVSRNSRAHCRFRRSISRSNSVMIIGRLAVTGGGCGAFRSTFWYPSTVSVLRMAATGPVTLTLKPVRKWRDGSLSRLIEFVTGFRRRTSSAGENESKITVVPVALRRRRSPVLGSFSSALPPDVEGDDSWEHRRGAVMMHCNTMGCEGSAGLQRKQPIIPALGHHTVLISRRIF